MKKKKSPTKILESEKEPIFEAGLIKSPGGEWEDYRGEPSPTVSRIRPEIQKKYTEKPASYIHTHQRLQRDTPVTDPLLLEEPESRKYYQSLTEAERKESAYLFTGEEDIEMQRADVSPSLPSREDLIDILMRKTAKSGIIGQRDPLTGKIAGYFVIRRTKKTPAIPFHPEPGSDPKEWEKWESKPDVKEAYNTLESSNYGALPEINPKLTPLTPEQLENNEKALTQYAEKYHLQIKKVPAEGYFYEKGMGFLKKKKESKLEQKVIAASILSLFAGIILLSAGITGNAIADLSVSNSKTLGTVLFIIGLIGGFFLLKKRKQA